MTRIALYYAMALVSIALLSGCGVQSSQVQFNPSAVLGLDEKLAHQYQRYEAAQRLVVERHKDATIPVEQRMISRADWEAILALPPDEMLSADELAELKARQAQHIQQARELAIKTSVIDFGAFRTLPAEEGRLRIRAFCEAVPKGGMLHVHPWGNLNQKTFKTLVERSNPLIRAAALANGFSDDKGMEFLYPNEIAWLRSLPDEVFYLALSLSDRERMVTMAALPPGAHSFERFEAVFSFVALAVGDSWENLVSSYEDFAVRAVREGVFYVEFTDNLNPQELPQYVQLADRLATKYGLTIRYNISYSRIDPPAKQDAIVQTMLREIDSPLVTGIDLLANERNTPALKNGQAVYGPVLAAVMLKGQHWQRTMHAGELGDVRNPRDALLLGAERLGHGVRLNEDPVTLQYAADRHIPIEINLTSNLKLQAVKDIAQHPFLAYLRLGLPVSLSTDDEGIFLTDINDECVLAVEQTDVTYSEYKEMAFNSIRTSFASEDLKQRLLRELQVRFDRFEAGQVRGK